MDVAAFAGIAASGPLHTPVAVEDEAQFAALFGGDAPLAWDVEAKARTSGHLAPAVRAFFRHGGRRCWVVRVGGPAAAYDVFELPGLARLGPDGIEPAQLRARSEGSWADGLRAAAALEAATLALVDGDGRRFTFAVSRPGALAPGDLVRITSATQVVFFAVGAVGAVAPAPAGSPLPGDRRALLEATAVPGTVTRLLREPPPDATQGQATYRDEVGRERLATAVLRPLAGSRDAVVLELLGDAFAPAAGALVRVDTAAERI
jgi:hypothetical protein